MTVKLCTPDFEDKDILEHSIITPTLTIPTILWMYNKISMLVFSPWFILFEQGINRNCGMCIWTPYINFILKTCGYSYQVVATDVKSNTSETYICILDSQLPLVPCLRVQISSKHLFQNLSNLALKSVLAWKNKETLSIIITHILVYKGQPLICGA
jgi:hypothetical protein